MKEMNDDAGKGPTFRLLLNAAGSSFLFAKSEFRIFRVMFSLLE